MDAALQARLDKLNRMNTTRIDGIEYMGDPELIAALNKAQAAIAAAEASTKAATTRADAAEGARDGAVKALETHKAGEQTRIDSAVTDRVNLLADAALVMGDKLPAKGTNRELMVAAVKHVDNGANMDSASDDYVKARFDMAATDARAKVQGKNRAGNGGTPPGNGGNQRQDNTDAPDAGAARARMMEGLKAAGRPKAA